MSDLFLLMTESLTLRSMLFRHQGGVSCVTRMAWASEVFFPGGGH